LNTTGRLTDEQQFRDIILKTGAENEVVRLGDVARVEMGAQHIRSESAGQQGRGGHPIFQAPNSNALALSDAFAPNGGAEEGLPVRR